MIDEKKEVKYLVSPGPHLTDKISISKIMYMVIIALLFPVIGAIYYFGIYVLFVIIVSILAALITEYVAKKFKEYGLKPKGDGNSYLMQFKGKKGTSYNVIGYRN